MSRKVETVLTFKEDRKTQQAVELLSSNVDRGNSENYVVSEINNLLKSKNSRASGLEILGETLNYFSLEIFVKNAFIWSAYCIAKHSEDHERELKLTTLAKIMDRANGMEFFTKRFSMEHLNDTFKSCFLYQNNAEKVACIKCLTECMKIYPSSFGNFRNQTEELLLDCLKSSSKPLIKTAANSFLYFQQTGPTGANGEKYIHNFQSNFSKLCATIRCLRKEFLLHGASEVNRISILDEETFKQLTNDLNVDNFVEIASERIVNCLIFLKTMIRRKFPVEKRIAPSCVIDLLSNVLLPHSCSYQTLNNRCVYLKKICLAVFNFFKFFIEWNSFVLMPFSVDIENCLINLLREAHNRDNCFGFDPEYKIYIYDTSVVWLTSSRVVSESHLQKKIIPIISDDIFGNIKTNTLNLMTPNKNNLKLNDTASDDKDSSSLMDKIFIENICIHALELLKYILVSNTVHISSSLKELLLLVIRTMLGIQVNNVNPPFHKIECQVKLYEVFIVILKKELNILPPIHVIITILNSGLKHWNRKISQISDEGLEIIEKISHPVIPTLYVDDVRVLLHNTAEREPDNVLYTNSIGMDNNTNKEIHILSNILISDSSENKETNHEVENVNVLMSNISKNEEDNDKMEKECEYDDSNANACKSKEEEPGADNLQTECSMDFEFQDVIQD